MKALILLVFISFSALSFENCTSENIKIMEKCSFDNYKKEDAYLNYLYKSIIDSYPNLNEDLKITQRAWLKARDNICTYKSTDGDEFQVYKNSCLYEQTYERNRELKAIITRQSAIIKRNDISLKSLWMKYVKLHCNFMQKKYSDSECEKRNNFLHNQE